MKDLMRVKGTRRGGFGGNATHVLAGDLANAEAFTERMRPDPLKRPQLVQGGRWGAWGGAQPGGTMPGKGTTPPPPASG